MIESSICLEERKKTTHLCISKAEYSFEFERYSSYVKLLRVFGYVLRFANMKKSRSTGRTITSGEMDNADKLLVGIIHSEHFSNEIDSLKNSRKIHSNSKIINFNPFLCKDQILRSRGRLQNSELLYESKFPVIMPEKCYSIELLIKHTHESLYHLGAQSTLAKLREKYIIMKGRKFVKQIVRKCIICKEINSKTLVTDIAPFLKDRVCISKAFSITGIDFAGPLIIRDQNEEKAYVCLFVCATTRAIHLELVNNLTTNSFINALKRFISRRGLEHTIYSDNAKTFQRADKDLKILWKNISHPDTKQFYNSKRINWKFIREQTS